VARDRISEGSNARRKRNLISQYLYKRSEIERERKRRFTRGGSGSTSLTTIPSASTASMTTSFHQWQQKQELGDRPRPPTSAQLQHPPTWAHHPTEQSQNHKTKPKKLKHLPRPDSPSLNALPPQMFIRNSRPTTNQLQKQTERIPEVHKQYPF
jgi:hypothetical protein